MTSAQRHQLKHAIDQARRKLIASQRHGRNLCVGCGAAYDCYTRDCIQCRDRHRNRADRRKRAA